MQTDTFWNCMGSAMHRDNYDRDICILSLCNIINILVVVLSILLCCRTLLSILRCKTYSVYDIPTFCFATALLLDSVLLYYRNHYNMHFSEYTLVALSMHCLMLISAIFCVVLPLWDQLHCHTRCTLQNAPQLSRFLLPTNLTDRQRVFRGNLCHCLVGSLLLVVAMLIIAFDVFFFNFYLGDGLGSDLFLTF